MLAVLAPRSLSSSVFLEKSEQEVEKGEGENDNDDENDNSTQEKTQWFRKLKSRHNIKKRYTRHLLHEKISFSFDQ